MVKKGDQNKIVEVPYKETARNRSSLSVFRLFE